MAGFKVGDKVKVIRTISSVILVGDTAVVARVDSPDVGLKLDSPRGPYLNSIGSFHCWTSEANLALVEEPAGEKMIPASKVREIAKLYAERHGWCGVVDDALREMGAQDDTMVEVAVTSVRTIRLRRSDLDKLHTFDTAGAFSYKTKLNAAFIGSAPDGATLQNYSFSKSEPVEVKPESDGWVDCGSVRPAIGARVRVRPGIRATSHLGFTLAGGSEGVRSKGEFDDDVNYEKSILVELPDGAKRRFDLSDLQVLSS